MQIIAARFTITKFFILLNLFPMSLRVQRSPVLLVQRAGIFAIPLAHVQAASPQQIWFCRS